MRTQERPSVTHEGRTNVAARIVLGLAVVVLVLRSPGAWKAIAIVVAVALMIMLHEFGHFVMAKRGGMKVTEFFVGFGPRLWSFRRGETEYGIKALPLGGYVKIVGMHNLDQIADPADEPRTYRQQPFLRRLAVAVAGSAMHFVIAFVLLFGVFAVVGLPQANQVVSRITGIKDGPTPAADAGFRVGDRVVGVDGTPVTAWAEIPPYIRSHPNQPIAFTVERGRETLTLTATPASVAASAVLGTGAPDPDAQIGFIGLTPGTDFVRENPIAALKDSATNWVGGDYGRDPNQIVPGFVDSAKGLVTVLSPAGLADYARTVLGRSGSATPDDPGTRFLSPVGVVRLGAATENGIFEVLSLLVMINLFVGLFNMLPMLPLDGGHVVIAVYEAIRSRIARRRWFADVGKLMPFTYALFVFIVFVGVSALYLDIARPLQLQ